MTNLLSAEFSASSLLSFQSHDPLESILCSRNISYSCWKQFF